MVKAMQADGLEWGEGYRPLGRQALAAIIEGRLAEAVDTGLERLGPEDLPDRRNGHYRRHLLTALGDIELCVPRTRRFSPAAVLHAYAWPRGRDRSGDPGRLRARAVDAQGGRGVARPAKRSALRP